MDKIFCKICNQQKNRKDFYKDNVYRCKECRKKEMKKYRNENAEAIKIKKKEYSDRKTAERRAIREANKEILPENHKKCNRCSQIKSFNNFYKAKKGLFNLHSTCKRCNTEQKRLSYKKNKNNINQKRQIYRKNNIEKIRAQKRAWNTSEKGKRLKRNYYHNIEKHNIQKRIAARLRCRIWESLKKQRTTTEHQSLELLGCDIPFLIKYIERQFDERMSWNNYGNRGWHIDHFIPCISFDLTKKDAQLQCFNYTNLRPLWHSDNCSKAHEDKKLSIIRKSTRL